MEIGCDNDGCGRGDIVIVRRAAGIRVGVGVWDRNRRIVEDLFT